MRIDQTGAYGDSTLPIDPDLVAVVTQFILGALSFYPAGKTKPDYFF